MWPLRALLGVNGKELREWDMDMSEFSVDGFDLATEEGRAGALKELHRLEGEKGTQGSKNIIAGFEALFKLMGELQGQVEQETETEVLPAMVERLQELALELRAMCNTFRKEIKNATDPQVAAVFGELRAHLVTASGSTDYARIRLGKLLSETKPAEPVGD